MIFPKIKKYTAAILIIALLAPSLVKINFSYSADRKLSYNLVAILVEENLFGPYGINHKGYLFSRINRYAQDLQAELPNTQTLLISINKNESPLHISQTLENLYFNGQSAEDDSHLTGIVLVGEVPLPLVEVKDHKQISLYPYTDFIDKAYEYDPLSQKFKIKSSPNPQPEIWHGIISSPLKDENEITLLSHFFDKNHLYHQNAENFADFDQKLFFADFLDQAQNLSQIDLNNYRRLLNHIDDQEYSRYTKNFLREINGELSQEMETFFGSEEDSPFIDLDVSSIPDVFIKNIADKYLTHFHQANQNYLNNIEPYIENSGRWSFDNTDTFPLLITQKDLFSQRFLRRLNDQMEKEVTLIVNRNLTASGITLHQEPTIDTLNDQVRKMMTPEIIMDLPVNTPRYVEFTDLNHQNKKIAFLNFYDLTKSTNLNRITELLTLAVRKKGEELNKIYQSFSPHSESKIDYAEILMAELEENSIEFIAESIYFLNLQIEEKQKYLMETLISKNQKVFPVTTERGYEALYIRGKGTATSLNLDINPLKAEDPEYTQFSTDLESGLRKELLEPQQGNECGYNIMEGVEIWEWFPAVICWAQNLKVEVKMSNECSGGDNSEINEFLENFLKEKKPLASSPQSGATLAAASTKKPEFSREFGGYLEIVPVQNSIYFTAQNPIDIYALVLNPEHTPMVTEDNTNIEFEIIEKDLLTLVTPSPQPVVKGQAKIQVIPQGKPGEAHLQFKYKDLIKTLTLTISDRKIKIKTWQPVENITGEIVNIPNKQITAGNDQLYLTAEIYRDNQLDINDSQTILRINTAEVDRFLNRELIVTAGKAETIILPGPKAGVIQFSVSASKNGVAADSEIVEIDTLPNKPRLILAAANENILVPGIGTYVDLVVYDDYGNIVNNQNLEIDIQTKNLEELDLQNDLYPDREGLQISTFSGQTRFFLKAKTTGEIDLQIKINDLTQNLKINVYPEINIELSKKPYAPIPGSYELTASLKDEKSGNLNQAETAISLRTIAPNAGLFANNGNLKIKNGQGKIIFLPFSNRENVNIIATHLGYNRGLMNFEITPGKPVYLKFVKTPAITELNAEIKIKIQVFDQFGRAVKNYDHPIYVKVTSATKNLGNILKQELTVNDQGYAETVLRTRGQSGNIHLIAQSNELVPAAYEIKNKINLQSTELIKIAPETLYAAFYGFPAGNVTTKNYLGGWQLFSGRTQAVTAFTDQTLPPPIMLFSDQNLIEIKDFDYNAVIRPNSQALVLQVINTLKSKVILEKEFKFTAEDQPVFGLWGQDTTSAPGVYFEPLVESADLEIVYSPQSIKGKLYSFPIFEVKKTGGLLFENNSVDFSFEEDPDHLVVQVKLGELSLGKLHYLFPQKDQPSSDPNPFLIQDPDYQIQATFTGISTNSDRAYALVRKDETEILVPSVLGGGFGSQDKKMLALAANNNLGESLKYNQQLTEVLLGDPTIKFKTKNSATRTGYDKTIGQPIYKNNKGNIQQIIPFNYNHDQRQDLILSFGNQELQLLEGIDYPPYFVDKGIILRFPYSILKVAAYDDGGDGDDDLLVILENSSLFLIKNQETRFTELPFSFGQDTKVNQIEIADMDQDGFQDFITTFTNGDFKIFYGSESKNLDQELLLGNIGATLDHGNLINEVMVHFPKIDIADEDNAFVWQIKPSSPTDTTPTINYPTLTDANGKQVDTALLIQELQTAIPTTIDPAQQFVPAKFDYVDHQKTFSPSTKYGHDLNGGSLGLHDIVQFELTLNARQDLDAVYVLDPINKNFQLQLNTLQCLNCQFPFAYDFQDDLLYLSNIRLKANTPVTFTYQVEVINTPQIIFGLDKFTNPQGPSDPYLDLIVTTATNPTGQTVYFSSTQAREYQKNISPPPAPAAVNQITTELNNLQADSNNDRQPDFVQDYYGSMIGDDDRDGTPNFFDDTNNSGQFSGAINIKGLGKAGLKLKLPDNIQETINDINTALDTAINMLKDLKCGGGCLNLPVNYAFFVSGNISLPYANAASGLGVPLNRAWAQPVFGVPGPTYPLYTRLPPPGFPFNVKHPVCTDLVPMDLTCFPESSMRYYISPTLNGGIATALCVGQGAHASSPAGGKCWAFAPKIQAQEEKCQEINADINQVISQANQFISQFNGKRIFTVGKGQASAGVAAAPMGKTPTGGYSVIMFDLGVYGETIWNGDFLRIPAFDEFGGIITRFLDNQIEEIATKLLVLPDFYLILPDPASFLPARPLKSFVEEETEKQRQENQRQQNQLNEQYQDRMSQANLQRLLAERDRLQNDPNQQNFLNQAIENRRQEIRTQAEERLAAQEEELALAQNDLAALQRKRELMPENDPSRAMERETQDRLIAAKQENIAAINTNITATQEIINNPDTYQPDTDFNQDAAESINNFINNTNQNIDQFLLNQSNALRTNYLNSIVGFYRFLKSIPWLTIEEKTVVFRVPWLTAKQITTLINDFSQWISDSKQEVKLAYQSLTDIFAACDDATQRQTQEKLVQNKPVSVQDLNTIEACQKKFLAINIMIDVSKLISNVEQNIEILHEYKEFPRKLMQYRKLLVRYFDQVLCYLESITDLLGTYIFKIQRTFAQWIALVLTINEVIKSISNIFNAYIDLVAKCKSCGNERYNSSLLAILGIVIPEIPIIPFPKWPDIVMDISQINPNLKIIIPNIDFIAEEIIFPKLPRLRLPRAPDINLNFEANIPGIPLLPRLPELPELPNLPPIPIVKLPDLPPPPKLPEFAGQLSATIKTFTKLLKLFCMLKQTLIPVDEAALKEEIERLTSRPSKLIPIDFLSILRPTFTYPFVDEIKVKVKVNMQLKFGAVFEIIKLAATQWNKIATDLVQEANTMMQGFVSKYSGFFNQTGWIPKSINIDLTDLSSLGKETSAYINDLKNQFSRVGINNSDLHNFLNQAADKSINFGNALHEYQTQVIEQKLKQADDLMRDTEQEMQESVETIEEEISTERVLEEMGEDLSPDPEPAANLNFDLTNNKFVQTLNQELKEQIDLLRQTIDHPRYYDAAEYARVFNLKFDTEQFNTLLAKEQVSDQQIFTKLDHLKERVLNKQTKYQNQLLAADEKDLFAAIISTGSTQLAAAISDSKEEVITQTKLSIREDPSQTVTKLLTNHSSPRFKFSPAPSLLAQSNLPPVPLPANLNHNSTPATISAQALANSNEPQLCGILVNIQNTDQVETVVSLDESCGNNVQTAFLDFDLDHDQDLIYALRGELYLKESFDSAQAINKASQILGKYQLTTSPQIVDFKQLQPVNNLVDSLTITREDNNQAVFSWHNLVPQVQTGVEIQIVNTVNHWQYTAPAPELIRRLFLIDEELLSSVQTDTLNQELFGPLTVLLGKKSIDLQAREIGFIAPLNSNSFQFNLPNGFYYARARYLDQNLQGESFANQVHLAPHRWKDTAAPIVLLPNQFYVSLFKPLTLDSKQIYDEGTVRFAWDSDNNGSLDNVQDQITLGPYSEVGSRTATIWVMDTGQNLSSKKINIVVYAPEISLAYNQEQGFSGTVSPREPGVPITLLRQRNQNWQPVITPESVWGRYLTAETGSYQISNLNLNLGAVIKNDQGEIMAEVFSNNGRIIIKDKFVTKYHLAVFAATAYYPARVVVLDQQDRIVANQYFQTDSNIDLSITDAPFNAENTKNIYGARIYDRSPTDQIVVQPISNLAYYFGGGGIIYSELDQKALALIDNQGSVRLLAADLELRLKATEQPDDPVIFEILKTGQVIFELYIQSKFSQITIHQQQSWAAKAEKLLESFLPALRRISGWDNLVDQKPVFITKLWATNQNQSPISSTKYLAQTTLSPPISTSNQIFTDLPPAHPDYEAIQNLFERGIIEGYTDGSFQPDHKISRAEFVKIALGATTCLNCTTPSASEISKFGMNQPFPDVVFENWFYFCVIKGKTLKMVEGYGDGFFRPGQNISRAEAAAVLLRQANVPVKPAPNNSFFDVPDSAWYKDYVYTGVKMGLIIEKTGFVNPEEQITRAEFARMASLILQIRDCQEIDSDQDHLPDYLETLNDLNPEDPADAETDLDQDGVSNWEEIRLGLPPRGANTAAEISAARLNSIKFPGGLKLPEIFKPPLSPPGIEPAPVEIPDTADDLEQIERQEKQALSEYQQLETGALCANIPQNLFGVEYLNGCPYVISRIKYLTANLEGTHLVPGDPELCVFLDYATDVRSGDIFKTAILNPENEVIYSQSKEIEIN